MAVKLEGPPALGTFVAGPHLDMIPIRVGAKLDLQTTRAIRAQWSMTRNIRESLSQLHGDLTIGESTKALAAILDVLDRMERAQKTTNHILDQLRQMMIGVAQNVDTEGRTLVDVLDVVREINGKLVESA